MLLADDLNQLLDVLPKFISSTLQNHPRRPRLAAAASLQPPEAVWPTLQMHLRQLCQQGVAGPQAPQPARQLLVRGPAEHGCLQDHGEGRGAAKGPASLTLP